MAYTIYNNIDKNEFDSLKSQIKVIEKIVVEFMETNNFYLNNDSSYKREGE